MSSQKDIGDKSIEIKGQCLLQLRYLFIALTSVLRKLIRYILPLFLLFLCHASQAQWRLVMEMKITDEGSRLSGAEIKVFRNGSLVETVLSDAKGNADIPMDPGGIYSIEIGGNDGLVTKKLEINTKNVPPGSAEGDQFFPAEVDLFEKIEGLDYHVLDEPIGKIMYSDDAAGFDVDLDYTKQRKKALDQLEADFLEQKEKEEELLAQRAKEYAAAIKIADKAFADEDWEKAEQEYLRAEKLDPLETYPSFQLAELKSKLIGLRETNKNYDLAIGKADEAYAAKDYQIAISLYKKASGYKPNEEYPQTKVSEIQALLANAAKADQSYLAAIEKGDKALQSNDLEGAKSAFEEATKVKPEEEYPKNKIAEINDILQKKQAKEQEYANIIKSGDDAFNIQKFEEAKGAYQKAADLKPTEKYPQDQISKIDGLLAAAAKTAQEYLTEIEKADQAFGSKDYTTAKASYLAASKIKPSEEYPKNKVNEIDQLLAQQQAAEKEYADKIKLADNALSAEKYEEAKSAFQEALKIKPAEAYPKEKLSEIDGIISQLAENAAKYDSAIKKGDQAYAEKDFVAAKSAYQEALSIQPKESYPQEKIDEIGTLLIKMEQTETAYKEAVQNGDDALANKDYEKAKTYFNEALGIKATEQYPKDKISEIDGIVSKIAASEKAYNEAIAKGDQAYKDENLEAALTAFKEAMSLKAGEKYPQDRIAAIEKEIAESMALEQNYNVAIEKADKAFDSKQYEQSIVTYKEALSLKKEATYPQQKIAEANKFIAEQAAADKAYNDAIAIADKAFKDESWEDAKTAYENAFKLKSEDYPKTQISLIDDKIAELAAQKAEAEKLEADYRAAIQEGDKLMQDEKYDASIAAFEKALGFKSEEKYPQDKVKEIKVIQAKLAEELAEKERLEAVQKEYDEFIKKADGLFSKEDLSAAREVYQSALALKSAEEYPQQKIEEINGILADAAEQDNKYQAFIKEADQLFNNKSYEEAKQKYLEASSIKSAEQYPKDKVVEIDQRMAELAKEQEEIRLQQQAEVEKENAFLGIIATADELFENEDYHGAKTKYEEALAIKQEDYPKEQIELIDNKLAELVANEAKAAAEAEQAKIDEAYVLLIKEADGAFANSDYATAKSKYKEALTVKQEDYPQSKIDEINQLEIELAAKETANAEAEKVKAEQAELERKYQAAIQEADQLFVSESYTAAKEKYTEALGLKNEQYPQDKLNEIDSVLKSKEQAQQAAAEQAKMEMEYLALIERGDQALQSNSLSEALESFTKAKTLKPSEEYPQNKIDEINALLAQADAEKQSKMQAIEDAYQQSISVADIAFEKGNYEAAEVAYKEALNVKPNENYPTAQITEIDKIRNEEKAQAEQIRLTQEREARNTESYNSAILAADGLFKEERWEESKNEYQLALGLKPSEVYPQNQIDLINQNIKKISDAQAALEQKKNAAKDKIEQYNNLITAADYALERKSFSLAKRDYQAALNMRPDQAYPKEQLDKVIVLIEKEKIAQQAMKEEENKPIVIKQGPRAIITDAAERDLDRIYAEKWNKRYQEKSNALDKQKVQVIEQKENFKEKEAQKREEAIERLNSITVSVTEQKQATDQLHMQNFETVQEKEENLKEVTMEWNNDSRRQREDQFADLSDKNADILDFQSKSNQNLIDGKKEEIENEYKENKEIEEYRMSEQAERIKLEEEINIRKSKDISEFNQSRSYSSIEKNNNDLKEIEEGWKETVEQYTEEDTEQRGEEFERINDKSLKVRQFKMERSDHFKENQEIIEEKTEDLEEVKEDWNEEAESRRQNNADQEFYDGEDKPRQDRLAGELPQGFTEEIIENPNGSTTIRRYVVNGTQTDIYEKTYFSWGNVTYTKNGTHITEETWDTESK